MQLDQGKYNVVIQTVAFQAAKQEFSVDPAELGRRGIAQNIAGILQFLGFDGTFNGAVHIGGRIIGHEQFSTEFPPPGCLIHVVCVPQRGGGDGGKDFKKTLTSIAIIATASWIAGPILGGHFGLWTSASIARPLVTTAIASMLSKSLIAPQANAAPMASRNVQDGSGRTHSITGIRNTANPNGPVPKVFGKRKMFPVFGAEPYTEIRGNDIYLLCLFLIGYGPVDISDMKIGTTDIDDYSDVSYNTFEGWPDDSALSIYTNDTHSESVDALVENGTPVTRTTQEDTTRISVDLCFKQGLFSLAANGDLSSETVSIKIEYSPTGEEDWSTATTLTVTEQGNSVVWRNHTWDVTSGQYDVKITRNTADSTDSTVYDTFYFFQLKSIAASTPVSMDGMAMVEMCIKATDQLSGIVDQFNCIVEAYHPEYLGSATDITAVNSTNGWISSSTNLDTLLDVNDYVQVSGFDESANNWNYRRDAGATMAKVASVASFAATFTNLVTVADEAPGDTVYLWKYSKTRNTAWCYLDVVRGRGALNPIADSRIYLSAFSTWATNCAAAGYKFDYVLTGETTQKQMLRLIAPTGRGSFALRDGKLSIVEDVDQGDDIKQMITSRNSWDSKINKKFIAQPHAFDLYFENEDADYDEDNRVVYFSGYDENSATKLEKVMLEGVTDPDQVWKEGRYRAAMLEHRPRTITTHMDFEHMLIDGRGDLVLFNNAGLEQGLCGGRITAVTLDGSNRCTHVTVDDECAMSGGTDYGITVRKSDNSYDIVSEQIVTNAGNQTTLEFTTPLGAADPQPEVGDLFSFGEYESETIKCIVSRIIPMSNRAATLILEDEGPAIYTADTGEIPAWTSSITLPTAQKLKYPPAPTLLTIRSNEEVLIRQGRKGDLITRALLSFAPPTQAGIPAEWYQARWKRSDETQWHKDPAVPAEANELSVIGLDDGVSYDFQVRSISAYGLASDWTTCSGALTAYTVIGKSTDPSDVTGFSVAIQGEKIRSSWTKVDDRDVSNYIVRYGETSDDWDDMLPVNEDSGETGDVSSFLSDALVAGTYKFAIKAKDTSGNTSDTEANAVLAISVPEDSTVTYDITDNGVVVDWDDCKDANGFPIKHYKVRETEGDNVVGYFDTTQCFIPAMTAGTYNWEVTAIDAAGNESGTPGTTGAITISGPSQPRDDGSFVERSHVQIRVTDCETDFDILRYEYRRGLTTQEVGNATIMANRKRISRAYQNRNQASAGIGSGPWTLPVTKAAGPI